MSDSFESTQGGHEVGADVSTSALASDTPAEPVSAISTRRRAAEAAARERLARLTAERQALEEAARERLLELAGGAIRREDLESGTSQSLRLRAIEELSHQKAAADQAARWADETRRLRARTSGRRGVDEPEGPVVADQEPEPAPAPVAQPVAQPVVAEQVPVRAPEPVVAEPELTIDPDLASTSSTSTNGSSGLSDQDAVREALKLASARAARERARLANRSTIEVAEPVVETVVPQQPEDDPVPVADVADVADVGDAPDVPEIIDEAALRRAAAARRAASKAIESDDLVGEAGPNSTFDPNDQPTLDLPALNLDEDGFVRADVAMNGNALLVPPLDPGSEASAEIELETAPGAQIASPLEQAAAIGLESPVDRRQTDELPPTDDWHDLDFGSSWQAESEQDNSYAALQTDVRPRAGTQPTSRRYAESYVEPYAPTRPASYVEPTIQRRRGPRWSTVLLGAAVGAGLALGTFQLFASKPVTQVSVDDSDAAVAPDATAVVERRDLIERQEWPGELRAGLSAPVLGDGGEITEATEEGVIVRRGDAVARVEDEPVIVLYGERRLQEPLADGVISPDVLMLETNLVALGYDPERLLKVDERFTSKTEAMVRRWQEDIGRQPTGAVRPSDIVVVAGEALIVRGAEVETEAVDSYATLSVQAETMAIPAPTGGELIDLPSDGSPLENGDLLFRAGDVEARAVMVQDPIAEVLTQPDYLTEDLESALVENGYEDDLIAVDSLITDSTLDAVTRWQREVGLPVNPDLSNLVYMRIEAEQFFDGVVNSRENEADTATIFLTRSKRVINLTVPIDQAGRFSPGEVLDVVKTEDGTSFAATVSNVIAEDATAASPDEQTVTVVLAVSGPAGDVSVGPVTVLTDSQRVSGATVVPSEAVSSPNEGVYQVTLAAQPGTRVVDVEIGIEVDGFTQIVSGDVEPGDWVVVSE